MPTFWGMARPTLLGYSENCATKCSAGTSQLADVGAMVH